MARGGHGGGRIRPSERNTDNATAIIGGTVALSEEHQTAVASTEAKSMKDSCRKGLSKQEHKVHQLARRKQIH